MAGKNKRNTPIVPFIILLIFGALIISAISGAFSPATVKMIEIAYGPNAQQTAQRLGKNDTNLQSASGYMNRRMDQLEAYKDESSKLIGFNTGYLYVDKVEKTGRSSIKITVNCRNALAIISSTKNAVIDEDGIVLDITNKNVNESLLVIEGLELNNPRVNVKADVNSVDSVKLSDAIEVAKVIRDNGYGSVFTGITMLDNREVRLATTTGAAKGIPVVINMRFDVLQSLHIAYGMMTKGVVSGGTIKVTGDKGYFDPDTSEATSAKGM